MPILTYPDAAAIRRLRLRARLRRLAAALLVALPIAAARWDDLAVAAAVVAAPLVALLALLPRLNERDPWWPPRALLRAYKRESEAWHPPR